MTFFEPGQIIAMSTGEYSDYGIIGYYAVARPFYAHEAIIAFKASGYINPALEFPSATDLFIDWLEKEGAILTLEPAFIEEWHLSCSELDTTS